MFYSSPAVGLVSLTAELPPPAARRYGSSGHVWRQMESGSVSGLSEMSLASAAHKETGPQTAADYMVEKRGSREEFSFNFNLDKAGGMLNAKWRGRKAADTGRCATQMRMQSADVSPKPIFS